MDRQLLKIILENEKKVLEIGPFTAPFIVSDHVRYFDVLDTEGLRNRALIIGGEYKENVDKIPKCIHYVSSTFDFGIINERFTATFSSHCIEHQPDLIYHLQQISSVLDERGSYYLCIPDKRYCFDYFKKQTTLSEVIEMYILKNRNARLSKFLDGDLYSTHNDSRKHWEGEHGIIKYYLDDIINKIDFYNKNIENQEYIDIHNFQFTPNSFYLIMLSLYYLNFIDLFPIFVTETNKNANEFYAKLQKIQVSNKQYILNKINDVVKV